VAVRKLGRAVSKIVARAEWRTAQALRSPQSSLFEIEAPFEVEAKVEELMFEMETPFEVEAKVEELMFEMETPFEVEAKVETSVGVMVA
jgi:hypothetical protein